MYPIKWASVNAFLLRKPIFILFVLVLSNKSGYMYNIFKQGCRFPEKAAKISNPHFFEIQDKQWHSGQLSQSPIIWGI